jgi:hypothetical protein
MLFPVVDNRGITLATTQELQQWLTEAEKAYRLLVTGQQAKVLVDQNGERIEFVAANAPRLLAYIDSLKAQLGAAPTYAPMRVFL